MRRTQQRLLLEFFSQQSQVCGANCGITDTKDKCYTDTLPLPAKEEICDRGPGCSAKCDPISGIASIKSS